MNNLNLDDRSTIESEIAGAIKDTIHTHGPITKSNMVSATKRIFAALKNIARRQRGA